MNAFQPPPTPTDFRPSGKDIMQDEGRCDMLHEISVSSSFIRSHRFLDALQAGFPVSRFCLNIALSHTMTALISKACKSCDHPRGSCLASGHRIESTVAMAEPVSCYWAIALMVFFCPLQESRIPLFGGRGFKYKGSPPFQVGGNSFYCCLPLRSLALRIAQKFPTRTLMSFCRRAPPDGSFMYFSMHTVSTQSHQP